MADKDVMRVSVVVPTVDRPQAVYNLLRHLEHQSMPPAQIVVVDQSERPDERLAGHARGTPSILLRRLEERGLPNARNVGVGLSTGDAVLFLDDDTIPDRDLVRAHAVAYADPSVAGVGGRVVGGYDAAGVDVGRFDPARAKVVRNFGNGSGRDVDHLPGGNMSFRREVFDRVGGFDVRFGGPSLGEETDFCLRARRAGYRLVFEPRASVEHLHLSTGGCREERFERWLYWHAHNSALFALRHARPSSWPGFLLRRVARVSWFGLERGSPALVAVGLRGLLRGIATYAQGS